MVDYNVHLTIRFPENLSRRLRWPIVMLLLFACAPELGSESVSLTTYYPAPSGVYTQLLTAGRTYLARNDGVGSFVAIGTADVDSGNSSKRARVYIQNNENQHSLAIDSGAYNYPEISWRTGGAANPTVRGYDAIATSAGGYFTGSVANSRIIRSEAGTIHMGGAGGKAMVTVTGTPNVGAKLIVGGQSANYPNAMIHIAKPNCASRYNDGAGGCTKLCPAGQYATVMPGVYYEGNIYISAGYQWAPGVTGVVNNCINTNFTCCVKF